MIATPVRVTAYLDSGTVGLERHPVMLDGPLSWAWAMRARSHDVDVPPITPTEAPDFPLPLARDGSGPLWVWCCSRARLDIVARTTVQLRRKPATAAMARFTPDARHHTGLGPYKARDVALPGELVHTATWDVVCTDWDDLCDLLRHVTHIGARHRDGAGHVTRWVVEETATPDAWRDRPMPVDGHPSRAPYWHASRRPAR